MVDDFALFVQERPFPVAKNSEKSLIPIAGIGMGSKPPPQEPTLLWPPETKLGLTAASLRVLPQGRAAVGGIHRYMPYT